MWFRRVLEGVAGAYGLRLSVLGLRDPIDREADIILHRDGSQAGFGIANVRGTHMIRDPRDVVVSGYFYHLWTDEKWCHIPRPRLDGKTYQEHLLSLAQDDGIAAEIGWAARNSIHHMASWDYGRTGFLELRYEEVLEDELAWFERIFRHYGFTDRAVQRSVDIAHSFSFERVTKRKLGEVKQGTHLRSGRPGEWRSVFTPAHVALFKKLTGPTLVRLGYEADENW